MTTITLFPFTLQAKVTEILDYDFENGAKYNSSGYTSTSWVAVKVEGEYESKDVHLELDNLDLLNWAAGKGIIEDYLVHNGELVITVSSCSYETWSPSREAMQERFSNRYDCSMTDLVMDVITDQQLLDYLNNDKTTLTVTQLDEDESWG